MAFHLIQPYQYATIRLPSNQVRIDQIIPNTLINLGKYGSFHTNQILGRPYHLTFEILDRSENRDGRELRIIPASELHAVELIEQEEVEDGSTPKTEVDDLLTIASSKSNVNIHDDPLNQKLTMEDIEALKQESLGSGRAIIEKLMQSHSTIDQKTAFSLAKYSLRKRQKFMKRFTILPLDVYALTEWLMNERDFSKVLEMRNECLGLVGCWANIHADGGNPLKVEKDSSLRYLVVDETGGLLVAATAERMGILHQIDLEKHDDESPADADTDQVGGTQNGVSKPRQRPLRTTPMGASSNSITLIHANQQPNLGLLRYFNFDSNNPTPSHPLYTQLKSLSWLQLLEPESDTTYQEPEVVPPEVLAKFKSNKRSAYFRKRRRWERVKGVVDETRAGEFNGLVVASLADPTSVLRHVVPLLAGGSQVVVYSPNLEPLAELVDHYSTARRTEWLGKPEEDRKVPSEEFPVDPTTLLAPSVQTSRVRRWQVLPGRTHPVMTSKGGAEGYVFSATRVLPADGKVQARGRPPRARKGKLAGEDSPKTVVDETPSVAPPTKKQKVDGSAAQIPLDQQSNHVET
ncbi:hypothetical protein PV10_06585 [Exophiala mesophila]|uniref:tRNA (adenine(58)-N(1))-methyltransferase non-catalytic subunit TRM6 n=1 Tax=Exophiala mesophila TaxID=212818 RepID=A0A0D1WSG4_EXOME|nr:uncharacterized protein PV10_06585 [Exophiala mesophila]KIV92120.1 hypothetical protein PV10_06585 [Exophiala mesophila]